MARPTAGCAMAARLAPPAECRMACNMARRVLRCISLTDQAYHYQTQG